VVLENNLAATESAARSPFRLWACRKLRNVREKISIFRRRMETTVHRTHKFFRMDWKNYRKRAQSLKASEARRIGKVWYENIARSSTFRWTPQKRNGYYSKQKISSMRVCGAGRKWFRSFFRRRTL